MTSAIVFLFSYGLIQSSVNRHTFFIMFHVKGLLHMLSLHFHISQFPLTSQVNRIISIWVDGYVQFVSIHPV